MTSPTENPNQEWPPKSFNPSKLELLLNNDLPELERKGIIREYLSYINYLEREKLMLEQETYKDSLTGIGNYSYISRAFDNAVINAANYDLNFSYVMFDIKNFKQYNDLKGYESGNDILRGLAKILKDELRDSDDVGRIGGDEFAAIINSVDINDTYDIINRIYERAEKELGIELHIGFSNYKESTNYSGQLISQAGAALNYSKNSGKPERYSPEVNNYQPNSITSFIKKLVDGTKLAYKGFMIAFR